MKRLLTLALLLVSVALSAQTYNCFGIIAGSKATADGSVMMAHNEDESGDQMLNIYAVPASKDNVRYLWFEFPGMSVADSYINEYGVCVASDGCSSQEDRKDLTKGGVLYEVRQTVAKQAHSAKEAVSIIGSLVEEYGYAGSGRTYVIADPKEGWIVSVVQGRHWVAQRVPDDCVMTIPNYYIIGKVDLSDTENFAGSADLVSYAESRGWYNPEKDGEFSFRNAYASRKTMNSDHNVLRHRNAYEFFFGRDRKEGDPIALKPNKPVTVQDMIDALSLPKISNKGTVLSTVFQLRSWLPLDKGCIAWTAMGHPNVNVFVPWYLGITKVPINFCRYANASRAEEKHFTDTKELRENYPYHFYWKYFDNWKDRSKRDKSAQKKAFKAAEKFEKSGKSNYNEFIEGFYK